MSELGFLKENIISIEADCLTIDALKLMSLHSVTSIAVVDNDGGIIGNISMTDIKFIFQKQKFITLWSSCVNMITTILTQTGIDNCGRDRVPVFYVSPESTLQSAIEKIVATKVHRVWIVTSNQLPVGVVSIGDILKIIHQTYLRRDSNSQK